MRVAVPVRQNGQIDDHFGHCEYYRIYSLNDSGEISEVQNIPSLQGCGCKSNIAMILAENGVQVMLAGGIGGGAIQVLNNSGIQVIRGCAGSAEKTVRMWAAGQISDSGESCAHHEHHHSHNI
jgi:predicted Fe-Mo cluster-binding NifX family protein